MWQIKDVKQYDRCEKMLWWSLRKPQPYLPFIYYNENIYDLSLEKLRISNYFRGSHVHDNSVFFEAMKDYDVFVKVSLQHQNLHVRIPILIKQDTAYIAYFLYPSCYPKEGEAQSIADALWVCNALQIEIKEVYAIHLNSQYVRQGEYDVDALLIINDSFYSDKNKVGQKISCLLQRYTRDLSNTLQHMNILKIEPEISKKRTNVCTRRGKCPYFNLCFHIKEEPTSILNLISSKHKFDMYESGIRYIEDLDFAAIEGTRHQYAQYIAATSKQMFFDASAIDMFLGDVQYPIAYLDFEWETYAFPPFDGMKPYDVLTFQYSLHIEYEDGRLEHREYLGKKDCREAFIQSLLDDLKDTKSIVCFNVEGGEKLRLTQLAKQFPSYADALQHIWKRMIDIAIPFASGLIYDVRMEGMYSLKKIVSIFTDYNYEDLDITHGLEAVRKYRMMENVSEDDTQTIKQLLAYCAMDTYATYLVYHFIRTQLKQRGY